MPSTISKDISTVCVLLYRSVDLGIYLLCHDLVIPSQNVQKIWIRGCNLAMIRSLISTIVNTSVIENFVFRKSLVKYNMQC